MLLVHTMKRTRYALSPLPFATSRHIVPTKPNLSYKQPLHAVYSPQRRDVPSIRDTGDRDPSRTHRCWLIWGVDLVGHSRLCVKSGSEPRLCGCRDVILTLTSDIYLVVFQDNHSVPLAQGQKLDLFLVIVLILICNVLVLRLLSTFFETSPIPKSDPLQRSHSHAFPPNPGLTHRTHSPADRFSSCHLSNRDPAQGFDLFWP